MRRGIQIPPHRYVHPHSYVIVCEKAHITSGCNLGIISAIINTAAKGENARAENRQDIIYSSIRL
jgi:hypothetical protein